jgi:signal recognition particle receptor subunit beta
VADSQTERMDANLESIDNLVVNLKTQGYDLLTMPYVLQLNKRDLPNVVAADEMKRLLLRKAHPEPVFDAVASKGIGVFETLKGVAKLVLSELTKTA